MFSVELEQSEIEDIVYEDIGVAVEKKSLAPMWFDHKKSHYPSGFSESLRFNKGVV